MASRRNPPGGADQRERAAVQGDATARLGHAALDPREHDLGLGLLEGLLDELEQGRAVELLFGPASLEDQRQARHP
jgi:hypothetical protein